MKKISCLAASFVIIISISAFAQEEKSITDTGDLVLGLGDLLAVKSFSGELFKDNKDNFSFNPSMTLSLQAFLYKGLAIGGTFNYEFKNYGTHFETIFFGTKEGDTVADDFNFKLGPSLFYYLNFFNRFIPFVGFTFLYSQQGVKFKNRYDNDAVLLKYKINSFSYEASVGFMYVIKKYFGIYLSYSFTAQMSRMDDASAAGNVSDSTLLYLLQFRDKELWGYCHTLNIGFKVFFDIL